MASKDEQAVGPVVEHAADSGRLAAAQAAEIVEARGVEWRVQPSLDSPALDVGFELLASRTGSSVCKLRLVLGSGCCAAGKASIARWIASRKACGSVA
jgi:hypothetical protein